MLIQPSRTRQVAAEELHIRQVRQRGQFVWFVASLLKIRQGLLEDLLCTFELAFIEINERHIVEHRAGFLLFTQFSEHQQRALIRLQCLLLMTLSPLQIAN